MRLNVVERLVEVKSLYTLGVYNSNKPVDSTNLNDEYKRNQKKFKVANSYAKSNGQVFVLYLVSKSGIILSYKEPILTLQFLKQVYKDVVSN